MNRYLSNILVFIFVVLVCSPVLSQKKKEELEEKKKKTQQEIEYANKLLKQTEKNKKESITQLKIVDKKIDLKKNVINQISEDIDSKKNQIDTYNRTITQLENDLKKEISEYKRFVYSAFKNSGDYDVFIYLLTADDINTAYIRLKYYKYYNDYRQDVVKKIKALNEDIKTKRGQLNVEVGKREELKKTNLKEQTQLEKEKQKRETIYKNLKAKESELKKKIEYNKRVARKLEDEINKLIKAQVKEIKANKNKLTPEDAMLSSTFKNNKGKLPWPVSMGIVTDKFGEHEHPVLKGNIIRNNGIDISTEKSQVARAVFNGEVKKVFAIPGANDAVIIRHGSYISVYQNLVNVRVKEGQKIRTKQEIGEVYSNGDEALLHFEIWEEFKKLNPEDWICNK